MKTSKSSIMFGVPVVYNIEEQHLQPRLIKQSKQEV